MPTYTDSIGFDKGTAARHERGMNAVSRVDVELDFAAIIAARAAAGATALAAADVIEVIPLAAGTAVLAAGIEVTSVESTNTTGVFHLGDTDADGYVASLANTALTSTASAGALVEPVYYAAADTIDVSLITAAPTDCVIRVFAIVAQCVD